ncbi:MAG: nickel pincer cofactor biosynthesis protein LarB [Phycisphaeraceae bacterium]
MARPAPSLTPASPAGFGAQALRDLLCAVAQGQVDPDQALTRLRSLPFEDLGFATLDHHRAVRKGFAEVVYCQGKTAGQVAAIVARLAEVGPRVLATRATPEQYEAARRLTPDLAYHELARAIWLDREPDRPRAAGVIVVAAGTSDLPVAEEASLTLRLMGHEPQRISDVGVAGLHRLAAHVATFQAANVIVAIAGMEGAMPSVIAGLVDCPVIAVPTSVGYGASFQGVTPLLGMLSSCAPGIGVVNIDNGFGAGYLAASINQRVSKRS